jgi:hypothetical protein
MFLCYQGMYGKVQGNRSMAGMKYSPYSRPEDFAASMTSMPSMNPMSCTNPLLIIRFLFLFVYFVFYFLFVYMSIIVCPLCIASVSFSSFVRLVRFFFFFLCVCLYLFTRHGLWRSGDGWLRCPWC